MRITIDRLEGNIAVVVLENGEIVNIPRKILPAEAKEVDIIDITVNRKKTDKRKTEIRNLENELFEGSESR